MLEYPLAPRACRACKALFRPRRPHQVFCSDGCRREFHRTGAPSPARLKQLVRELIAADLPALAKAVVNEIRKQALGAQVK